MEGSPYTLHTADTVRTLEQDACDWLVAFREYLTPEVELLDAGGHPLLPLRKSDHAAHVRELLTSRDSADLRAAIHHVVQSRQVEFATTARMRLALLAIDAGPLRGATLVLSEPVSEGGERERREHLQRVAGWIAEVVAARITGTPSGTLPWSEVPILHQVLSDALASGSDRDVVAAFVETTALWRDIDVRAYRSDLDGRAALDVSLPGANPALAPAVLAVEAGDARQVRLSAHEAAQAGFDGCDSVLLLRVDDPKITPWTIACLDATTADEPRLAVFADVLRMALQTAVDVEASRLTWTMMQRLVGGVDAPERAAAAAAGELAHATIAEVSLDVRRRDGAEVLAIGPAAGRGKAVSLQARGAEALLMPLRAPERYGATLMLHRPPRCPFTVRERRLAEVACSVLESWLTAVLNAGRLRGNRRTAAEFDQIIDARAQRATAEGADLALIVFNVPPGAVAVARESWVSDIRGRLRPFDVAGTLTTGEIGILLPDTRKEEAQAVVTRLKRSFEQDETFAVLTSATVGIATAGPGTGSIVRLAREDAGANTPRND